jgi:hypothetical protein
MLNVQTLESILIGAFSGTELVLEGDHAKGDRTPKAIAEGVVSEIKASAVVIVPPHAGGTYQVTGLSESGMSAKVLQKLKAEGINTDNEHCKAGIIPTAIAKAVTGAVLASMKVSIPTDGSGSFNLSGLSGSDLQARIAAELSTVLTLNGPHAKGGLIALAAGPALASYLNSNAVISGSFTPGGTYKVQ